MVSLCHNVLYNVILKRIVNIYYDTIIPPICPSTKGLSLPGIIIAKHRDRASDHRKCLSLALCSFQVYRCLPCQPHIPRPSLPHCFLGLLYHILNRQSTIRNNDEYLLTNYNRTMMSLQTFFSCFKGTQPWKNNRCYLIVPFSICSHLSGPPMKGSVLHFFLSCSLSNSHFHK